MLCIIFHQAGRWPTISSKWHPRCANKVTIRNVWRNRMCACSIHCIPPTKTVASSSTGHRASSASIECRRAWGRARRKRWASCLLGGENQIVCGEASKRRAASGEHRHQAPGALLRGQVDAGDGGGFEINSASGSAICHHPSWSWSMGNKDCIARG